MKKQFYCQCHLAKDNTHQVSWIPEEFAVKGKILELEENGIWQNGWEVRYVGGKVESNMLLKVLHISYKNTRKVSDI